ncbi:hypothetical protein KIM372_05910 [Bombiscardovia nodaiensis]|uniref:RCC1-like domain-containing protein n=1 Tax=Bombiscardovia nodaiensis TaxID=2932181 RepID=A0ABM8B758_9BIFI|nr:hypothetical protein KIM372_05910 [Bombiscardovia nodaiensis]
MRRFRTVSAILALISMSVLGGGSTSSLTHPTPAHADETSNHFRLNPTSGPAAGGTSLTITPTTVGGVKFTKISSNTHHTLSIGDDGNAYAWGNNENGELGDNTLTRRLTPIRVTTPAGIKFTQVSAAGWGHFSLAIGTDGNIYSWGRNTEGELGLGDTTDRRIPTKIALPTGVNRFTSIATGQSAAFALADNGKIYSWGSGSISGAYGAPGQLGVGDYNNRLTPTPVVGIPSNVRVKSISSLWTSTMALGNDGRIYSWGTNDSGQLGVGDTTNRSSAVAVNPPTGYQFTSITMGAEFASATASDGNLYRWGSRQYGCIGDGIVGGSVLSPIRVTVSLPGGASIKSMVSGGSHTLVLATDGKAYSWGDNRMGQLGNTTGLGTYSASPVQVTTPAGVTFISVTAGGWNSFAIGSDGNTYAWGMNWDGALGDCRPPDIPNSGSYATFPDPARVGGVINITKVTIGGRVTSGSVNAVSGIWSGVTLPHAPGDVDVVVEWTLNGSPQPSETLKYRYLDTFTVSFNLDGAPGSPPVTQSVLEGSKATWPTTPTWGGKLFTGWYVDGKPYTFNEPVTRSITLTAHWEQYTFSLNPSSGSTAGGTTVAITPNPKQSAIQFSQISVGWYHTLGLGSDGRIYAWGRNDAGQLGDNTTDNHVVPMVVKNTPTGVKYRQVVAGPNTSFALGSDNRWYAWGANTSGQLGNGNTTNQLTPVAISMPAGVNTYTQVSPGENHTLALGDDGTAYAWGSNTSGQLGNNTTVNSLSPVKVQIPAGVFHFTSLSAGSSHSIAIGDNGLAYAWGSNQYGQLGSVLITVGDKSLVPVEVQLPVGVSKFKQATASANWSISIGDNGRIITWGYNTQNQLGNGNANNQALPAEALLPTGLTFTTVTPKANSVMTIANNGSIYAWGMNTSGQLGNSNQTNQPNPIVVNPKPGTTFAQLHTAYNHTIGIDTAGNIYAWGDNSSGQLGDNQGGSPGNHSLTPVSLIPVRLNITGVTVDNQTPQTGPTYDPGDGTWKITTRPHAEGTVPVSIAWSLAGVQQTNYPLTYTYGTSRTLPAAGTIPLHRISGSTLLALSVITAVSLAGHQLSKARKRKQGQHSPRPNHSNRS